MASLSNPRELDTNHEDASDSGLRQPGRAGAFPDTGVRLPAVDAEAAPPKGTSGYSKGKSADIPVLQSCQETAAELNGAAAAQAELRFTFGPELTLSISEFCAREHCGLFALLFASLALLLARYTGSDEAVLTGSDAGAHGSRLDFWPLRLNLACVSTFRELLQMAAEEERISRVSVHRALPLEAETRGGAVTLAVLPAVPTLPLGWRPAPFETGSGASLPDLQIEVWEMDGALQARLRSKPGSYDPASIDALPERWQILLGSALTAPDASVWGLRWYSEREEHWLLHELNATAAEYPRLCVTELVRRQAEAAPERVALRFGAETLTYAELDSRADALAGHLASLGCGQGSVAAIMLPRSPDLVVALLAVLKTGAAYTPLDPVYPDARLEAMVRGAEANLLLTHSSLRARFTFPAQQTLELDALPASLARGELCGPGLDDPAYLLFTSGSTGEPKGVAVSHRNLTNLLCAMQHEPGLRAEDAVLAVTSVCFDISALELYLPLITGARIELASAVEAADPLLLRAKFASSGITMLQATPITWRLLLESGWEGAPGLKALCDGEAMTQSLAAELLPRVGELWNMYGPTETTIWSAVYRVLNADAPPPLGHPIANTALYILDARGAPVPSGVPGELAIGGDGLALGYWRKPALTAERFPTLAPGGAPRRLYRTGDRVLRTHQGALVFLGRTDKQIKLRGFRIELGEIEAVIRRLPEVQDVVVLKQTPMEGEEFLAAWIVPNAPARVEQAAVQKHLRALLPAYMHPASILTIDAFPRSLNGKLDKAKLPQPVPQYRSNPGEVPRPGLEARLAALWCELLGVPAVSRDDDFFALGGSSLLAARLLARVPALCGRRLSLAALVQAPTLAQLARVLAGESMPRAALLKEGSSPRKRLFWLGASPWLRKLAERLAPDQTLYALAFDAPSLAACGPGYSMEVLAARMVAEVRAHSPGDPYMLGGFCLDGLLAYEAAQQLRAAGQEVSLLILADVSAPGRDGKPLRWHALKRFYQELDFLVGLLRCRSFGDIRKLFAWRYGEFQTSQDRRRWQRLGRSGKPPSQPPQTILQALYLAETRCPIAPYPGRVCFLEAQGERRLPSTSTASTWTGLLGPMDRTVYPGEHLDFFDGPCLELGAAAIREAMTEAAGEVRGPAGPVYAAV